MGLNNTLVSQRCHIAFFGCRNAGKSSLINALTNQNVSVVSPIGGTTTDPVKKTMEILPIGPVVIIDTAGIDDVGQLGQLRIEKTKDILAKTDVAVLVVNILAGLNKFDNELINIFNSKNIPYVIAYNKCDLKPEFISQNDNEIMVSAVNNININELKEKIGFIAHKNKKEEKLIIEDKLDKNDIVVLVIPIDESAPKGRLILPQQNVIKELLDFHHIVICTQVEELDKTIKSLNKKPKLVITDSQAFKEVKNIVSDDILLTSFSILFARYKGDLDFLLEGIKAIKNLKQGDKILISEGCTHHRQCNDIGSVKIPKWLKEHTGLDFEYEFSSGETYPSDLEKYSLIIHCGGCMLSERVMKNRIEKTKEMSKPMINYGIFIAYMTQALNRALEIFPDELEKLNKGE